MAITTPDDDEGNVQVPLYSRLVFPDIPIESLPSPNEDPNENDIGAAMVAVRAGLGVGSTADYQVTASSSERTIRIKPVRDFPGRAKLPTGVVASQQSEWRAFVCFPGEDEIPAEQSDVSAREIVERGGRIVVVIPVAFSVSVQDGDEPPP